MTQSLSQNHTIQWQVLLDENEWDRNKPVEIPASENAETPLPGNRAGVGWYMVGLLLALALVVGVRLWQQAQSGLTAVERGLDHTLTLENQVQTESELLDVALHRERALARVQITEPESGVVYRESRFYRETEDGWLRSQPVATLWGSPRTLESEHFVFHFRQRDGAAVAEAASLLDSDYLRMHAILGLPLLVESDAEAKIQVRVAAGGEAIGDIWYDSGEDLWVVSPLLLRLPERVSEAQALAEVVAIPLRRSLVNSAAFPVTEEYQPAPEFLSGLRLWLAWQGEMPVSSYRRELVGWLYANTPVPAEKLPVAYVEVCEISNAWQTFSPTVQLLFRCATPSLAVLPYSKPPTTLSHLPLSIYEENLGYEGSSDRLTGDWLISQAAPIATATMLEYVTHTYGQASVAALLQAAKEGKSWYTAAPQISGLSPEKFEAGWWEWLATEYGVDATELASRPTQYPRDRNALQQQLGGQ